MTPAGFDTRRRLLGLSLQETADYCGVQRRTVERWCSGYSDIATSAIDRLDGLESQMGAAVDQAVDGARRQPDDTVALLRYRTQAALDASPHAAGLPLGAHAMLIGWIAEAMADLDIAVDIVWA